MTPKQTWSTGKKILLSIGLFVILLIFFSMSWWRGINADPQLTIPTPKMPSPNARDFYIKAADSTVKDKEVDDALMSVPIPGRKAPRVLPGMPPASFQSALAHKGQPAPGMMPGMPGMNVPYYTLAQRIALIKANAPALATLRRGFAYEYREPPSRSFFTLFPHYAKFRQMARLLALASYTEGEQGDWNGAMNSGLDAIRMGQDIPRGGVLIGMLVGIAAQAIGHKAADATVGHLNAQQARAAAKRVEDILAHHVPYADVLQEEKWQTQAGLLQLFRQKNWRPGFLSFQGGFTGGDDEDENGGLSARERFQRLKSILQLYFVNKRQVLDNYTHFMDQCIANARQPYAANLPYPPVPDDPINQMLIPIFSQARQKIAQSETQNAQLALALALHAYRLEHGHYPDKLTALVPSYLKKLPDDPMALQGSYGYQRDKDGSFTLYSLSSTPNSFNPGSKESGKAP